MGAKGSRGQRVTNEAPTPPSTVNSKASKSSKVQSKPVAGEFGMYSQPHAKTSVLPVVSALDLKQFAKDALVAHNDYRKSHNAPRMSLDAAMCTFAQNWADVSETHFLLGFL